MTGLNVGAHEVYQKNIAVLKRYSDNYYKVTLHSLLRQPGYEEKPQKNKSPPKRPATGKFNSSISRTKAKIFELAMCNEWEYFVTLTFNGNLHDRNSLTSIKKKLSKWLNNYNRLNNTKIITFETNSRQWMCGHGIIREWNTLI